MKLLNYTFFNFLFMAFFSKAILVNIKFISQDETLIYRVFQSVFHDSFIFLIIFSLVYLSYLKIMPYFLSFLLRLISIIFIILYLIDIFILLNFANHLTLNDLLKYTSYAPKYLDQLYSLDIYIFLLVILFLIFFINFLIKKESLKRSSHYFYIALILALFVANLFSQNGRFIHSWLYKNFIEYNYEIYEQSKEYSKEYVSEIKDNEIFKCYSKKKEKANIIILMVESLASYQSQHFSGIKNWTKNLDRIAKENISYKNFFANGFVTEDAEIAMLTGEFPIYAPKIFSNGGGVSFNGFYNIKDSLTNILKKESYTSEFITSSDLNFSNTGNWVDSIGFDYKEGSEHHDYKNRRRLHFGAASDEYLYARVLKRLKKQNSNYLLFIKTVSSHAPFINPENLMEDEEQTIKYIDKQIGFFYEALKKDNFFENGILFIVGDHHPVIPLKKKELSYFGELKASSATPLVIAYKNQQKELFDYYQQSDIYTTIKNLVSTQGCTSQYHGDLLKENSSSKYIIHRRGDQRGIISIFTKEEEFNIKLQGDDTHSLNKNVNKEIIEKINFSRIEKQKEEYKFKD